MDARIPRILGWPQTPSKPKSLEPFHQRQHSGLSHEENSEGIFKSLIQFKSLNLFAGDRPLALDSMNQSYSHYLTSFVETL
jgi:hypothetical protein